jgi:glutamate N-acetyltransferase/amino-acid N-acetyltransferase
MSAKLLNKILPVAGIRLGVAASGERYKNRNDLLIMELSVGASSAVLFTKNVFCAAPVVVARRHLEAMTPRYLIVNAGNANAGTGIVGEEDSEKICDALAKEVGCPVESVLPFSTGIIGQFVVTELISNAIDDCLVDLSENNWAAAGKAIMTTDTRLKARSATVEINGALITVTGIAKGSGMIKPDMATMLAFVSTDATVSPEILKSICEEVAEVSFNRITVDGDTSTNDAFVLTATGTDQSTVIVSDSEGLQELTAAIALVCSELAKDIVRDGEGATKFVTITVFGDDEDERTRVAYAVAESPLVKTALFASDANWGRILAAVGRSVTPGTDLKDINIDVSGVPVVKGGEPVILNNGADVDQVFSRRDIEFSVYLKDSISSTTVWTCDFSHDYVRINAEYRT